MMHATRIGNISCFTMLMAVICPPIHSIVVTSPNDDHSPPALAAITIIPANQNLSFFSLNILEYSDVITMAVVKLSSRAERKKVSEIIIRNNLDLLVVFIFCVIMSKPS